MKKPKPFVSVGDLFFFFLVSDLRGLRVHVVPI